VALVIKPLASSPGVEPRAAGWWAGQPLVRERSHGGFGAAEAA